MRSYWKEMLAGILVLALVVGLVLWFWNRSGGTLVDEYIFDDELHGKVKETVWIDPATKRIQRRFETVKETVKKDNRGHNSRYVESTDRVEVSALFKNRLDSELCRVPKESLKERLEIGPPAPRKGETELGSQLSEVERQEREGQDDEELQELLRMQRRALRLIEREKREMGP